MAGKCTPDEIDSFCTAYQKVIIEKGDGAIKAPLGVRIRLAANEVNYKCLCEGWKDKLCERKVGG